MARFVYGMQNVLNVKEKTENQVKMEFAVAQQRLNEQIDILEEYKNRKLRYLEEAEQLRSDVLNVRDIVNNQYACSQMDLLIKQQQVVIQNYQAEVDKVRVKLTQVVQERKMQEALKERAFQLFLEEQKAEEAKENDQRTSFTYGQRIQEANRSRESNRVHEEHRLQEINRRKQQTSK